MKIRKEALINLRLSFLLIALAGILPGPKGHAQIVVIANQNIAVADISKADLRDVFTGASSSFKGVAQVTPVLLKQGTVNEDFLDLYVGKSDSAFRASWRSILFSGQGVLPRTLDSDAAVVEYVSHTPGAIGYIGRTSPHEGVKTLIVR
jgi:ABC-type phosphate transport system substrate-binding protein